MSGAGGITSIALPLANVPRSVHHVIQGLISGETVRGLIVNSSQGLALQIAGATVALPSDSPLSRGQIVDVTVKEGPQGRSVHVTPRETPPSRPETALQTSARVLQAVAQVKPGETLPPALTPPHVPLSETVVRSLASLFIPGRALGGDLQAVQRIVAEATQAGALPRGSSAADLLALIGQVLGTAEREVSAWFRQIRESLGKPLEARLARLVALGRENEAAATLRGDLRGQLVLLLRDEGLTKWLRASGQLRAFQSAVNSAVERLDGARIQSLRALDQPFYFLELPLLPGGAVEHAQVYVFGEGHSGAARDTGYSAVELDLNTNRLGALWVSLQYARGHCTCHFRAVHAAAFEAIERAASELETALVEAGYPQAAVRVSYWDGDRLLAAAEVLHQNAGVDVRA